MSAGEHKVTVTVELADGTVVTKVQTFNSGNPRFHSYEFAQWAVVATARVDDALTGIYGDTPGGRS